MDFNVTDNQNYVTVAVGLNTLSIDTNAVTMVNIECISGIIQEKLFNNVADSISLRDIGRILET